MEIAQSPNVPISMARPEMAVAKRKAEPKDSKPSKTKTAQPSPDDRPAKRPRTNVENLNPISLLQQEEARAFPRGGGDGLTPLERKQVQIQATRDVLFEEAGKKKNQNQRPESKFQRRKERGARLSGPSGRPLDLVNGHANGLNGRRSENTARSKQDGKQNSLKLADSHNQRQGAKKGESQPVKKPDKPALTWEIISAGMIVSGVVSKTTDRSVIVQLSHEVAGRVSLTEMADDYDDVKVDVWKRNDTVSVYVMSVDKERKLVPLSMRPSRVLGTRMQVKDTPFAGISELKIGDIVRGFIKNITDAGVFVSISDQVTGFVHLSELSDAYLKAEQWKAGFALDKLVTGRITKIDETSQRLGMSLKASVVDPDYKPMLSFLDLSVGQIITGKIRHVKDFGAFVVVDNSNNVSGLCHRSEMADTLVEDATKLYQEGDVVKAKVLTLEPEKRRISFGLKASYFETELAEEDVDDEESGSDGPHASEEIVLQKAPVTQVAPEHTTTSKAAVEDPTENEEPIVGLKTAPFDFSGAIADLPASSAIVNDPAPTSTPSPSPDTANPMKHKKRKPIITEDHTADLSLHGPRSVSDYERLLLSRRDDSSLWLQYMAFHLSLQTPDSIPTARSLADRALREISDRQQLEKMNVWIAFIALEVNFGTDDSVEQVFTRAVKHPEPKAMHEALASEYIKSGQPAKAEGAFKRALGIKEFRQDASMYLNYARFLLEKADPVRPHSARDLLHTALRSVLDKRQTVLEFATMEFKTANGDPEHGRTMFEGLFDSYRGRWDHWDVLVELEGNRGEWDNVRRLFERMTGVSARRMREKRAKAVFGRWEEMERRSGDGGKGVERVRARREEYLEGLRLAKLERQKAADDGDE
ncbi:MAG: rRNA biogenesis protein rrp5 [Chrysothrix sp. TS-e1954]|nr:MAG: rRNA biogenesis protein rrp5 [Chrysothrix sp. TS-e1954]